MEGVGGQRDTRLFLSFVQHQQQTFFLEGDRVTVDRDALWRFLDGPSPEFRDPARFALLEAFSDAASYSMLGGLFKSLVPFRLDDLDPETFAKSISANLEHALEPYVELADRVGVLETLLRKALVIVPDSRKLRAVGDALERWRVAARRTVLTPQFLNETNVENSTEAG
jgi:hypothetical protein